MKLSVIIVSYNEINYIEQAIQSCLEQKFSYDYEIIIGDDGSDDGSIGMIDMYSKKYSALIQYFVMERETNSGIIPSIRVSNIIRKAFSLAQGEYIVILSGDDFFDDYSKFETQVKFLEENKKYVACYSDYKKVWDNGNFEKVQNVSVRWNSLFWSYCYAHISCFMFRRNIIKNIPSRFFDDTGLIYTILKSGKIFHIPKIMFSYRQRDNSIMHEADQLELDILELLLFQDIRNSGGLYFSSLSRFGKPLIRCYKNRNKIKDDKYNKYFESAIMQDNDILMLISNYDINKFSKKLKIKNMLVVSKISIIWFKFIRKINKFINCLDKK